MREMSVILMRVRAGLAITKEELDAANIHVEECFQRQRLVPLFAVLAFALTYVVAWLAWLVNR